MKENMQYAYLAGVMDGDGSFIIDKIRTKANALYTPQISCNSSKIELALAFIEAFGGKYYARPNPKRKDGTDGRIMYSWSKMSKGNVAPILQKLIPYLQTKRQRAEHLLAFCQAFEFVRGIKQTPEQIAQKEKWYVKMISFNHVTNSHLTITKKRAMQATTDKLHWAYIAGLMDTDGYFQIKKQISNKGTDVKNARYTAMISFSSADTRAINFWLNQMPYGVVSVIEKKTATTGYHFSVTITKAAHCLAFLEAVLPYLRAKKQSALVLQDFLRRKKNTGYCRAGVSPEELKFREQCYNKMRFYNNHVGSINLS